MESVLKEGWTDDLEVIRRELVSLICKVDKLRKEIDDAEPV